MNTLPSLNLVKSLENSVTETPNSQPIYALISVHGDPTAEIGKEGAGGQNVYVRELGLALAKRGCQVDMFTRREHPDQEEIKDWDWDAVWTIASYFPALIPQPDSEQTPYKLSFWLDMDAPLEVIHDLQDLLTFTGLQAEVIFSNGRDVDIIPKNSNKGKAAAYLQELLQAQLDATVICGGSGNDISLFQQPSAGIIVANAQTELLWWYYKTHYPWHFLAHYPGAAGILEGLIYFNILPFPNSWRAMGYAPP